MAIDRSTNINTRKLRRRRLLFIVRCYKQAASRSSWFDDSVKINTAPINLTPPSILNINCN
jgi:hypothetical protein